MKQFVILSVERRAPLGYFVAIHSFTPFYGEIEKAQRFDTKHEAATYALRELFTSDTAYYIETVNTMKTNDYDFPSVGCYVDESSGSADDCNERTIDFAKAYGFPTPLFSGCFDGLRGSSLNMTLEDALSASHSGRCDEDVEALAEKPEIVAQLDVIGAETIRAGMKEAGAWDAEELADDAANRLRAVWQAACDIRENKSEQLSEMSDEAVEFLNDLETRSFMSWQHEDNSLFLTVDVDGAREDCEFVSGRKQDEPAADYRGEWLHVSDHGNATLYVRDEKGEDKEIWGVV